MKFIGVREAQVRLSALVQRSQAERVILTRHGHPVAVLTGIEGKDLEDEILFNDPAFRTLMSERLSTQGPLVSHEALLAETEAERARGRRRRRPQKKKRQRPHTKAARR